jgi:glucose/arabinose dehydrogenase
MPASQDQVIAAFRTHGPVPQPAKPPRAFGASTIVALALLVAAAAGLFALAHVFARYELATNAQRQVRPAVTNTRPAGGERDVLPTVSIAADVHLPNNGQGVDAKTLNANTVRLYRADNGQPVNAHLNTTGSGDAIVLVPRGLLEGGVKYVFEVTEGVTDTGGHRFKPYRTTFTTVGSNRTESFPAAFEQVATSADAGQSAFVAVTFGPDRRLYAGTYDGRIFRWDVAADGTLSAAPTVIPTVIANNRGPRLITGITFDPRSTGDAPVVWVSHGQMKLQDADDFTGKISRLSGPDLKLYEDTVVDLPRGYKDHLNFQLAFGPDGAIYFDQGSHTSTGAPDTKWGGRSEHKLTAAVLRLDVSKITSLPLSARTEPPGTYDPAAPGAALTIYATGVRSAFDLLWHSNGKLYASVNGAAAGGNAPDGPAAPGLTDITSTADDTLIVVEQGRYYGHPNPSRGEFVLNGGNPTPQPDAQEVPDYPVGTRPDPKWKPPAFVYGKNYSPNGMVEYATTAAGEELRGAILVARYSGGDDVVALRLNADGSVKEAVVGIDGLGSFTDPLDLALDPRNGNLYVAQYGGHTITLLRPKPGGVSKTVVRQKP